MGTTALHAAALVSAVTGLLLIWAAVATPVWMQGCFPLGNVIDAAGTQTDSINQQLPGGFGKNMERLKGMKMCIRQGLFKLSMLVGNVVDVGVPIDVTSLPRYVFFAVLGFGTGMIFTIGSIVMLILAARGSSDSYEMKARVATRTRRAMMMLGVAATLMMVGMAVFTGGTAGTVHQPMKYMGQFGQAGASSMSNAFGGGMTGFGSDYPRRDPDKATQDALLAVFQGMDPVYGYSFIIGWMSVLALIISLVLAVVAKQYLLQHPYSGASVTL